MRRANQSLGLITPIILLVMLSCSLLGVLASGVPPLFEEAATTPVAHSLIFNAPAILSSDRETVEDILGKPLQVMPIPAGEMDSVPGGGHNVLYDIGSYRMYVSYDTSHVARNIEVIDGLASAGYRLDDWRDLMSNLGFETDLPSVLTERNLVIKTRTGETITLTAAYHSGPVLDLNISKE